jgi:hypothetical protein
MEASNLFYLFQHILKALMHQQTIKSEDKLDNKLYGH